MPIITVCLDLSYNLSSSITSLHLSVLKKSLFSKSNSMGWKCSSVSETTGAVEHFRCSSTGKLSDKIWWKTRDECMTPSPNVDMQVKPRESLPYDSDITYQFLEWGLQHGSRGIQTQELETWPVPWLCFEKFMSFIVFVAKLPRFWSCESTSC